MGNNMGFGNDGYQLCNPNASEAAKKVYNYICTNFGKSILAGQQESVWGHSPDYELDYILETTGKLPALRGLDYIEDDFEGVNERAKEWWKKGGLVSICWHTGLSGNGYKESQEDNPDFEKLLTEGTPEYNKMIADWDRAAQYLAELRDANVPVLWRPFHEFDGAWFWWGKGGGAYFIQLWKMMYERYTKKHGLHNLIWVLGYADDVKDGWYPGDEYCDIIGSDTYNNSTHKKAWEKLQHLTNAAKPLTFHECGNVPAPEDFLRDECIWSWFLVWHTKHILENDKENLKKVYNSDLIVTLDKLPDFN